jgi:hypothetical protein
MGIFRGFLFCFFLFIFFFVSSFLPTVLNILELCFSCFKRYLRFLYLVSHRKKQKKSSYLPRSPFLHTMIRRCCSFSHFVLFSSSFSFLPPLFSPYDFVSNPLFPCSSSSFSLPHALHYVRFALFAPVQIRFFSSFLYFFKLSVFVALLVLCLHTRPPSRTLTREISMFQAVGLKWRCGICYILFSILRFCEPFLLPSHFSRLSLLLLS